MDSILLIFTRPGVSLSSLPHGALAQIDSQPSLRGEACAPADSAVIAAAANPANKRFSVVVIAGLSAASTLRAAPLLGERSQRHAEVVVLPHGAARRALVVPAKELVRDITEVPVLKAGTASR
jgi:hypothetical protein